MTKLLIAYQGFLEMLASYNKKVLSQRFVRITGHHIDHVICVSSYDRSTDSVCVHFKNDTSHYYSGSGAHTIVQILHYCKVEEYREFDYNQLEPKNTRLKVVR